MLELETQHARLRVSGDPLRLQIEFQDPAFPRVEWGRFAVRWRRAGWPRAWEGVLRKCELSEQGVMQSAHGPLEFGRLRGETQEGELGMTWTFALARDHPLALWRVSLSAVGARDLSLAEIDLLKVGRIPAVSARGWLRSLWPWRSDPVCGHLDFHGQPELAWLAEGWQSWSFSGVVSDERIVTGTRLGPLTRPMYLNPGTRRLPGRSWRSSEFFTALVDRRERVGLLAGLLSERQAFGSLEGNLDPASPALRLYANGDGARLPVGERFTTDWAALQPVDLDREDPLGPYLDAVARENTARVAAKPPVGWSSWYFYFEDVSQRDVQANLDWAAEHAGDLPLEILQIDDGYQETVGDWLETAEEFPDGMAEIADRIEASGFTPGLWLAPFAARPDATLVRDHPGWLLRRSTGRPVRAGYNWGTFFVALDVTHPGVLDYVRQVVRTAVDEWGYRYLKLDFLYAGALRGRRRDRSLTRAQALRRALEAVREAAGEGTLLAGCGCPLGSGVGVFDAMRVGPDVAARWKPAYQGLEFFFEHEPSLPSARNSIQNTLSRAALNGRWWVNDPDCLLLRSTNTHLTEDEVQCLLTVAALSGGSHLVSEALDQLDSERMEWLGRLLPPLARAARVVDGFERTRPQQLLLPMRGAPGEWWLFALVNWEARQRELQVQPNNLGLKSDRQYLAFDQWRHSFQAFEGRSWRLEVPAHGVRFLRLQEWPQGPAWVGDSLHVSGGAHVASWRPEGQALTAELDLQRWARGRVWLALPSSPVRAALDGRALEWQPIGEGVYAIELPRVNRGQLRVEVSANRGVDGEPRTPGQEIRTE